MKIYMVKNLWKNKDDFGSDEEFFDSKKKATKYFNETLEWLLDDYEIEKTNENLKIEKDNVVYAYDYDYFNLFIEEREVL